MRFRTVLGLVLVACCFVANAAGSRADVRKQIEMSMLITGTLDIAKDGTVFAHKVDQPEKLPPAVLEIVGKVIPNWRFEPVLAGGKVVNARTRMSMRVVAKQKEDGDYLLRIGSTSFGEEKGAKGETVTARNLMKPPRYPETAYRSGIQGTVYLVLKVDRNGNVAEVIDEQVNLRTLGNERQMEQGRKMLAKAAIIAAQKWEFDLPMASKSADESFQSVRVPVSFELCDSRSQCSAAGESPYGTWEAYIPGPKSHVPWISEDENRQNPDAMIAGMPYSVGSGPKLLTPLSGS